MKEHLYSQPNMTFSSKGIKTANKTSDAIITQICLLSRTALIEVSSQRESLKITENGIMIGTSVLVRFI